MVQDGNKRDSVQTKAFEMPERHRRRKATSMRDAGVGMQLVGTNATILSGNRAVKCHSIQSRAVNPGPYTEPNARLCKRHGQPRRTSAAARRRTGTYAPKHQSATEIARRAGSNSNTSELHLRVSTCHLDRNKMQKGGDSPAAGSRTSTPR